jgi:ABC-2 type transport system permease protein
MSPIHDQGYRRYGGQKARTGTGWAVIARAGIRTFLAKRIFLGLLLLPQAQELLAVKAEMFRQFLEQQQIWVFFITVYVGAGLIANDRRANALQIYLSKPLTRTEYIVGKLTILMSFLLFVTWVPAIVLLFVQIAFAGNFTFLASNLYLFPAITVFSFLEVTAIAVAMLALSSLSKSSRYVAILYAAVLFFTQAIYSVLAIVTRDTSLSWISLPANLSLIGDVIFRLTGPPRYTTPWPVALAAIIGLIAASVLILEKRVRGVEVVA